MRRKADEIIFLLVIFEEAVAESDDPDVANIVHRHGGHHIRNAAASGLRAIMTQDHVIDRIIRKDTRRIRGQPQHPGAILCHIFKGDVAEIFQKFKSVGIPSVSQHTHRRSDKDSS